MSSLGIKIDLGYSSVRSRINGVSLCYVEISEFVNGRRFLGDLKAIFCRVTGLDVRCYSMTEHYGEVEKKFYPVLSVFLLEIICLLRRSA
jgi:hypothetical protein